MSAPLRKAPAWLKWYRRQEEAGPPLVAAVVCWLMTAGFSSCDGFTYEFLGALGLLGATIATFMTAAAYFVFWLETVEK